MPKTLQDCLLDGGVRGKTFAVKTMPSINYTVTGMIILSSAQDRIKLYVGSEQDIGTPLTPNSYCVDLSDHYQDVLIRKKSTLPIPLPAP